MADSWKMFHIHVACHNKLFFIQSPCHWLQITKHISLLPLSLHPSTTDSLCLCLWCCDSSDPAALSTHSFHPRSLRGWPNLSQSLGEGIRQMHDLADGRQVHGLMTSIYVVHTTVQHGSGAYRQPSVNRNPAHSSLESLESGWENYVNSGSFSVVLQGNWIGIKGIHVFQKGLEGCSVFSNNRNASGVDLHCPLLPFPPPLCPQNPCFEGLRLLRSDW